MLRCGANQFIYLPTIPVTLISASHSASKYSTANKSSL